MTDYILDRVDLRGAASCRPKGGARPAALPCHDGNNYTRDVVTKVQDEGPMLTGGQARSVWCLVNEVEKLCKDFPLENVGFVTLTFADNIIDRRQAAAKFRSFNVHFLSQYYTRLIVVSERQKRGCWHYHCVVACRGFLGSQKDASEARRALSLWYEDRAEYYRILRKFVGADLKREWRVLREAAAKYGFGRCEIMPVETTGEAIARYVGKYIRKGLVNRIAEDKGVRRVSYINFKGSRTFRPRFGWNTPGARRWRRAVWQFALEHNCMDTDDLKRKFGKRWCYKFSGILLGLAERLDRQAA